MVEESAKDGGVVVRIVAMAAAAVKVVSGCLGDEKGRLALDKAGVCGGFGGAVVVAAEEEDKMAEGENMEAMAAWMSRYGFVSVLFCYPFPYPLGGGGDCLVSMRLMWLLTV